MARPNLLALGGALLSIVSIALVWFIMSLSSNVFGSTDTDLTMVMRDNTAGVSVLFIIGAFIVLWTQLGVLLELPAILFFPFVIWYGDFSAYWVLGYLVALAGVALSICSSFVQMTVPGWRIRVPPESRIRVWFLWKDEHNPMSIPKRAALLIKLTVVIALVISSGVVIGAYVQPLSKFHLNVIIDSGSYGAVNLTVVLDDKTAAVAHLEPQPTFTEYNLVLSVTAGSHRLVVDVTSSRHPETNNSIDYSRIVKAFPFTTRYVRIGIGVGFI